MVIPLSNFVDGKKFKATLSLYELISTDTIFLDSSIVF
jgi:hypothetical protein